MRSHHENPFDHLTELRLNSGNKNDLFESTSVHAELWINDEELEADGIVFDVAIVRAELELETWGCDVRPGSQFDPAARRSQSKQIQTTETANSEYSQSAEATIGLSDAKLGIGAKEKVTDTKSVSELYQITSHRVTCRGSRRWTIADEVSKGNYEPLSGQIISNEKLCDVSAREEANLVEVSASLTVRRRDIKVEPHGNPVEKQLRKRTHQEKFIQAIVARSVSTGTNSESHEAVHGRILLSKSTLSGDDDAVT